MVDDEQVIEFLTRYGAMGKPEDSPWPSFDPDTQEQAALDLHRFMTDDAYLIAVSQVVSRPSSMRWWRPCGPGLVLGA